MFIRMSLICLTMVALIVGEESENPTRVGKFLGLFAVNSNDGYIAIPNTGRRWKGELSLQLGRRPLFASVELHYFLNFRPSGNHISSDITTAADIADPSNATSTSAAYNSSTQETSLDTTTANVVLEEATSKASKLEDYDEITFDPDVDGNRVRREATTNVKSPGNDGDDESDSTTVESSTNPMILQDISETISSPPLSTTDSTSAGSSFIHQPFFYPYPPSRNPSAQYVTFTHSPLPLAPTYPPMGTYYKFHPSQLDYNYLPYCINPIHHKYTPSIHDTWSNYRKWK